MQTYDTLLSERVDYGALSEREQRFARMRFFPLWPNGGGHDSYQAGLDVLDQHVALRDEIQQLLALGLAATEHVPLPLEQGCSR